MESSLIAAVLIAFLFGALGAALIMRMRLARLRDAYQHDCQQLEQRYEQQQSARVEVERMLAERDVLLERERQHSGEQARQLSERDRQFQRLSDELQHWQARCVELETIRDKDSAHHAERLALLEAARGQLKTEFEHLAGRIFDERNRTFTQQSQHNLEALLQPFREQVGQFRERVEALHGEEMRERTRLSAQLEQLAGLNRQMSEDAANLTRALKGDTKMQGNWGELILEKVLERSGLRKNIEYRREVALEGEQGRGRPDAIIYLPEGRHLIVDAKVSLVAYSEFVNASEDDVRERALKAHLRSVRNHVDTLSAKDYPRLNGLSAPDLVFMFMPIEPAFAVAFEHDDHLFHHAFARHIVIVTPTTLLASLRTVASLWRIEQQNDNARAITERAEKLLDKFHGFVTSMEEVGTHLERATGSHRQAMNRLCTGQGSLVSQARTLNELGIRMKKQLPEVGDVDPYSNH
ncbi:DNA recombination protein RmuC [Phytohalomonas tamaricis]|uniref:DNA recombination protein RmuC n=1 Tax=Phytohalomonas tamaricis TaxID=2081032 RepID=UPI000D0BABBC|nr:DNA recombination protein RmuC [Phytohalomonas tamaricis]